MPGSCTIALTLASSRKQLLEPKRLDDAVEVITCRSKIASGTSEWKYGYQSVMVTHTVTVSESINGSQLKYFAPINIQITLDHQY